MAGSMSVLSLFELARKLWLLEDTPFLALRVPALERIAWRRGREAARELEQRCQASFSKANGGALRAGDLLAHDDESEIFVAALTSLPRDESRRIALPMDCRATLVRLIAAMERSVGVEIEGGWTIARDIRQSDPHLTATLEAALQRGARERERYAFFSTVGHELRTPLTSIRGYLDTLIEEKLDADTTSRFLEIARSEALRLGRLVEGMFQLSMLDLGERTSCAEETDVARAIRVAIEAAGPTARSRGVTIIEHVEEMQAVFGIGFDRLVQVLSNLLDNALKHGVRGGRILIGARALRGSCIALRVEDDGPGVALDRREAIFELGERAGSAAEGSGIGLAVARLIVERCGGEIAVSDSSLGGASFEVRLPNVRPVGAEAGFTLLEAVVSAGLLALVLTGLLVATTIGIRDVAKAKAEDALSVTAHNVLVDLTAATAYDQNAIAALSGSRTFTITEPNVGAPPLSYVVHLSVTPGRDGQMLALVHVSDRAGHFTDASEILSQAAPAPGSTVFPGYVPGLPGKEQ